MSKLLVTGCAGFIGHALCLRLLADGHTVIGLDNMNAYYDVSLKRARLDQIKPHINFAWEYCDLQDNEGIERVFALHEPEIVVNLAAQAGVRYSLENPQAYIDSNITGFANILEMCVKFRVEHLVYASSSSVYGRNEELPFSVDHRTDNPANMYAVTKKANELMAKAYSNLYGLKTTGLRFFTVYGPWGRPDMAFFKFTKSILKGEPIEVYNNGEHSRSFTYIDDVIEGIVCVIADSSEDVYNIGGDKTVRLMQAISLIEAAVGQEAILKMLPMQKGDVESTVAEPSRIKGYSPKVSIEDGIARFTDWFRGFYSV
jgi:UDP-glucuronate 4-epimerase